MRDTSKLAIAIINGLNNGALIRKEELSAEVFERVLDAAESSRRMPQRIKDMLHCS